MSWVAVGISVSGLTPTKKPMGASSKSACYVTDNRTREAAFISTDASETQRRELMESSDAARRDFWKKDEADAYRIKE